MDASRRNLIKGAALGGVVAGASALGACAPNPERASDDAASGDKITTRTIAEAEKIIGMKFTPAERAMMVESLEGGLETLARIRAIETPNSLAPALVFNPRLPGRPVAPQDNTVSLGGDYSAPFPASEDDVAFASVAQLGRWLRSRAVTSASLTELYLARIERFDPTLHAYITVTPEIARAQAAKADADFAAGVDKGPLQGIPYGLKDLIDTKGVLTTWGATPYRDRVPNEDARIVTLLREAGAVLLGKTTCGAIAYGDIWFGEQTRNPWNPLEGSSGSSAGSGASTAAGLCAFAIGTETLGSIVSPSERCGTTGLRPTFGRVSRTGAMALCWSLDKIGAICRSVEDTALVLSAINGYDVNDAGSIGVGFNYDGGVDISGMKVGYAPAWFEEGDDADRAALEALRSLGVVPIEFPWPKLDFGPLFEIVFVESAAAFSELTFSNRDDEMKRQDPDAWPNTWRAARFKPAVDYVQVDRLRRRVMQEVGAAFDGFDALIGPNSAGGALLATNCTGHPQLIFRAGYAQTPARTNLSGPTPAVDGAPTFKTPRGVSLWGGLFEERKIVALGRRLEQQLAVASDRPPGF